MDLHGFQSVPTNYGTEEKAKKEKVKKEMNRKMGSRKRFLTGILQNFLKVKGSLCWNACQGALRVYTLDALQPRRCSSPLSINLVSVFSDSIRVYSAH